MNVILIVAALAMTAFVARQFILSRPGLPLDAARTALEDGSAMLVDVREPDEWADGVVKDAALLPLSDLKGGRTRWRAFLEKNRGRRLFLYCRAGTRAGMAASLLRGEGFEAVNLGGFDALAGAGMPVCKPETSA